MFYKTSDIARKTNIHPNTVRFYERIGLILSPPRGGNGYRLFDDRHLYQVMILRCIFLDEWPGKNIRKASLKIIHTMKLWELKAARKHTKEYIETIQIEYEKAKEAVEILKKWEYNITVKESRAVYSRTEAATIIGTTPEALRNWERNGLIEVPRIGENQRRIYGQKEIERLRIIYMLRQSKYSMSAIYKCLRKFDDGCNEEALHALHNPDEGDIVWTGDHLLHVLENTMNKGKEIFNIIDEIEE